MGIISHEGMPRKLTQEKFAERATKVHDGKYDYSLVCYINTASKVKIICSEHGIFEQSPNSHLAGYGCPECVGRGKSNNERFIRNAKGKHGDKYDYSLVNFVDSKTKVKIICPTHGIFEQLPSQHFIYGCNKCAIQARTHTLEYFANQANIVHDGKYDYKLVNYINNCTKVDIICPTHGIFRQTPAAHLFGFGCHGCGIDSTKLTLDEIIGRANIVHDFKYDYSLAVYISSHDNIEIICPTHGVFKQQVGNHLFGSGCRKC